MSAADTHPRIEELLILKDGSAAIPVRIDRYTDTGAEFTHLKLYQGINGRGHTRQIRPDPAYAGMNAWAKKHGLPPPNLIKTEDMKNKAIILHSLKINTEEQIDDPAEIFAITLHMMKNRASLLKTRERNSIWAKNYTIAVNNIRNDWLNKLDDFSKNTKFVTHGRVSKDEALLQEVLDNERARALAAAWCLKCNPGTRLDAHGEKIMERDLQNQRDILEEIQRLVQTNEPWDKIHDIAGPRRETEGLLLCGKTWNQLSQLEKHLFTQSVPL